MCDGRNTFPLIYGKRTHKCTRTCKNYAPKYTRGNARKEVSRHNGSTAACAASACVRVLFLSVKHRSAVVVAVLYVIRTRFSPLKISRN